MPRDPLAFPAVTVDRSTGIGISVYHGGMTLRDWFAGQALSGVLASRTIDSDARIGPAIVAYEIADAMLEERKRAIERARR